MGVTKILMASNDTLFNFEDTLGDDAFSPRNSSHSECNTNGSNTPQPTSDCCTPVNDILSDTQYVIDDKPFLKNLTFNSDDRSPTNIINELLSPELVKTFSEDINTVELASSDLSGTMDVTTNTLDDLKTCISVHIKHDNDIDEAKNNSEPLSDRTEPISEEILLNGEQNSDEILNSNKNNKIKFNQIKQQNDFLKNEIQFSSRHSSSTDSDSIGSSSKENENPNERINKRKLNATIDAKLNFNSVTNKNNFENNSKCNEVKTEKKNDLIK